MFLSVLPKIGIACAIVPNASTIVWNNWKGFNAVSVNTSGTQNKLFNFLPLTVPL